MKVLLATKNDLKIKKWGELIKSLGYELITLKDLTEKYEEPKEDGQSVMENALKKAKFYYDKTNFLTITTDSSLYIDGLSEEEQIGLFAGREIKYDNNKNIVTERELSYDENFERYYQLIDKLGGQAEGYFNESIVIYYGTNSYCQKEFKMERNFKTPPSTVRVPKAPMRSFVYYQDINKYRSELDNDTANQYDSEVFKEQQAFFRDSLYKASHMMKYNFSILNDRIKDASNHFDYENFENKLKQIRNSCLCIGTAGSYPTSTFARRILAIKNQKIITNNGGPRQVFFLDDFENYENMLAITYGNDNNGINRVLEKAKLNNVKTYILTNSSKNNNDGYHQLLTYPTTIEREYSFISMASTFIPMSLLLKYYMNIGIKELNDLIDYMYHNANHPYPVDMTGIEGIEIMSGDNTNVAAQLMESAFVESGLSRPIIHEKYDGYCHGRSNLAFYNRDHLLIYLINGKRSELDDKVIAAIMDKSSYKNVIFLTSDEHEDKIVGEFDLSMKGMFLIKSIAERKDRDVSKMIYSPQVKKLYKYKGEL